MVPADQCLSPDDLTGVEPDQRLVVQDEVTILDAVPKLGLDAPIHGGKTLRDLAPEVLAIARDGLASRGALNSSGDNETGFLGPLDDIVASGTVPAQRLLDLYHGEWAGDVTRVYEESF